MGTKVVVTTVPDQAVMGTRVVGTAMGVQAVMGTWQC